MIELRERKLKFDQWRVWLVVSLTLIAFGLLLSAAAWRGVLQGDMLVNESMNRYVEKVKLEGERGVIWDRNGRPLAMSSVVYSAHINPILFRRWVTENGTEEGEKVIEKIAISLDKDIDKLKKTLARKNGFAYLSHNLVPEKALQVAEQKLPYLRFEKSFRRFYPSAQETAHVTGFIDSSGKGVAGMEGALQVHLKSTQGEQLVMRTSGGRVLEELSNKPAIDGKDLILTIDSRLQYFASLALARQIEHHEAKSGSLILLDVQTGDILALANMPTFNPNNISSEVSLRRNRAVQDIFEPGSTMKPLLAAIAIEKGLLVPGSVLKTAKSIRFGKYKVSDKKIDTDLTLAEVIMRSSNVGAVRISQLLEDSEMEQGYRSFGIGSKDVIGVPGETNGRVRDSSTWRPIEKATMSYGYGLSANLLQIARAYGAIANQGMLPTPGLILGEERAPQSRTISVDTANAVISMLENVVSTKGTAPRAAINGYRVAGKTGTTHKKAVDAKGYDTGSYQSVFVGLAPASNPRFVCAVIIDEPKENGYYGGTVSAPAFAVVMGHALRMYAVPTDDWHDDALEFSREQAALALN